MTIAALEEALDFTTELMQKMNWILKKNVIIMLSTAWPIKTFVLMVQIQQPLPITLKKYVTAKIDIFDPLSLLIDFVIFCFDPLYVKLLKVSISDIDMT